MKPREKIIRLQELMKANQVDAWIMPSADPHQSEYVADHWKARAWFSGFEGSAGTLVVLQDKAGLWTDPRYHFRAARELEGSGVELFKEGLPRVPSYVDWLEKELPPEGVIGFDANLLSAADVSQLQTKLGKKSITFSCQQDLAGQLWQDRPAIPRHSIFLHDTAFAGETRASKIQRIRRKMAAQGAQAHLLTALDDIAWTFNIRGSDVPFNPVAIAYAVIGETEVRLFIDPGKVPAAVKEELEKDGVFVYDYEDVFSYWQQLPQETIVLIDPKKTSSRLKELISHARRIQEGPSIPYWMKAVKSEVELAGFRQAHIRDGAAVVKWLCWLDEHIARGTHTEITLAEKQAEFRSQVEHYQGLSFGTITGYQPNSAVGHYSPKPETTPVVGPEGILLIDSGGQYLDGTTDITRTITLGSPTTRQKHVFTTVLKSLIRLTTAKFPEGTNGAQLDALARDVLWQAGWECRHGIGHGVGFFLNVHEEPVRFRPDNTVPFEPGMVISNEPGVYFENEFGVRIENVITVIPAETTPFGDFYGFETFTLCPIDLDLVDVSLLSIEEKAWLNAYHQDVYQTLAPLLSQEDQVWLRHETRKI